MKRTKALGRGTIYSNKGGGVSANRSRENWVWLLLMAEGNRGRAIEKKIGGISPNHYGKETLEGKTHSGDGYTKKERLGGKKRL